MSNTNSKKILYFEGAGSETPETIACGVGNCRIRTAFHTKDKKCVYLELWGTECSKKGDAMYGKVIGWVDHAHYITGGGNDCNESNISGVNQVVFEYTPDEILNIVRSCGGDFDEIRVLPFLAGYRVFQERSFCQYGYNYSDEFSFDEDALKKRTEIRDELYRIEYDAMKKDKDTNGGIFCHSPSGIYPCFSLWVSEDNPDELCWTNYMNRKNFNGRINIKDGDARECIKKAAGWTPENYGDFSVLYKSVK